MESGSSTTLAAPRPRAFSSLRRGARAPPGPAGRGGPGMSMMMGGGNPGGGRSTPPAKETGRVDKATRKRNLRRVAALFKPYRRKLGGLVGLIVLSAALGMVPAFLTRDLIDSVF